LARARSVPNGTIRGFAGSPLQVLAGPNARRYMRWNASSTDDDALVVGRPGQLTRPGRGACSRRGADADDTRGDPRGIAARSRDVPRAVGAGLHPREGRRRTSRAPGAIHARSRRTAGHRTGELHRLRVRLRSTRAPDAPGVVPRMRIDAHRPSGLPDRSGVSTRTAQVILAGDAGRVRG